MDKEVKEFQAAFCPFGYLDIGTAIENYKEAGKSVEDLVEAINDWADATGTPLEKCDPVYIAYDTLHQEARTEIEGATGKDISNDEPYSAVNVLGNYMATSFDGRDEDCLALLSLINGIEEKSDVVKWLANKL